MARVKRGTLAHKRRKRMLKRTKGYLYGRSKKYRAAKEAWIKAGRYSYRDRRNKKRDARALWQIRISAGCKEAGWSYSKFMGALKKAKIELDRKILADLAANHPAVFAQLVTEVKEVKK